MGHLLDGTSGAGEQRLARLLLPGRRPPVSSYWTARLTGWRALLMLTAGRPDQAQALVGRLPLPVPVARVVRARLLLSDGDLEDAQVLLGARDPAEGPRLAVQRQLLLALAVLGTSEATAEVALSEATALAGDAGRARARSDLTRRPRPGPLGATGASAARPDRSETSPRGRPRPSWRGSG